MSATMNWRRGDPRLSINKRAYIIILRPSMSGHGYWNTGTAFVDTKEGWYIHTSFDDYRSIEKWDSDWAWTWAPKSDFKEEEEKRLHEIEKETCKECGYYHPDGTCLDS